MKVEQSKDYDRKVAQLKLAAEFFRALHREAVSSVPRIKLESYGASADHARHEFNTFVRLSVKSEAFPTGAQHDITGKLLFDAIVDAAPQIAKFGMDLVEAEYEELKISARDQLVEALEKGRERI